MEVAEKFSIQTESFQGPLELVIELIEKRKLLVNELTLAQITDDYVQYLRTHPSFPIEDAADFIGVAATLLLIKSKSLLPELDLTEEESEDVEELQNRLKMYEKTREAARGLSELFGKRVMVSAGEKKPEPFFAPSRDLVLASIESALADALTALEKEEKLPEVRVRPLVTIEEMMDRLTTRVQTALHLSFKDFAGSTTEKVEVIVSFLALLELVKQGVVDVAQQGAFGDIDISNTQAAVPRYG
ncbi:segregation/condensation protein A [Patescibacteria group bacterium]|nr:segregation/condensation protein A [Patescibacteria group bacterium]MBU1755088.1 segregation/condensation protein A [Patescibacteria group bacterium]